MLKMNICTATFEEIKEFRTEYLNSLSEFQELFLEILVLESDYFSFQIDNHSAGYAIINEKQTLIEYYVKKKYLDKSKHLWELLIKKSGITEIYCKSFDAHLMNNCLSYSLPYSIIGFLYRDFYNTHLEKDSSIWMKESRLSSLDFLLEQDNSINDLFNSKEQLIDYITKKSVFEFFKSSEFIGCGLISITNEQWNFCDLGVWVNPKKRGQYFGAQILLYLRELAIIKKMQPSCGCASDNLASQKIIEKCGFISNYKLLSFSLEQAKCKTV